MPDSSCLEGSRWSASGAVAQWLERGTHNPLVVGSIPTRPTLFVQFRGHSALSTNHECSDGVVTGGASVTRREAMGPIERPRACRD